MPAARTGNQNDFAFEHAHTTPQCSLSSMSRENGCNAWAPCSATVRTQSGFANNARPTATRSNSPRARKSSSAIDSRLIDGRELLAPEAI